ncbi:acyltransferase family protein [Algibacter lectus]|uniref:acyltransferase family protein n=1 Tax=Algibacter lectus TaxID=221126 RepID=UPI0026E9A9D3|nr:acyltransferase [Algibacter lectus]MDO7135401.1 acyltransferase [Algibacter lectus]
MEKKRLQSLDFLRAIAIVLVLFRHKYLFDFTIKLGWIGVDLFFVLSGFLVSGLLFREYNKQGDFNVKLFLIRRGFKIYPIYYLSFLLYIPYIYANGKFDFTAILRDLFFVQNYTNNWGYVYAASWSLAVEEHFYFGLCFLFVTIVKFFPYILLPIKNKLNVFEKGILSILLLCFILRVCFNYFYPEFFVKGFTMSHLRMDTLFFGVLISYWYYYKRDLLRSWFFNYKKILAFIAFGLLAFTPFIEPTTSVFVKTIGFTLLYISFGIILLFALLDVSLFEKIAKFIGVPLMNFICKVGFSSYSIYVIHTLIIFFVEKMMIDNKYIGFTLVLIFSILAGLVLTKTVERYFLKLRDKLYKSRY